MVELFLFFYLGKHMLPVQIVVYSAGLKYKTLR